MAQMSFCIFSLKQSLCLQNALPVTRTEAAVEEEMTGVIAKNGKEAVARIIMMAARARRDGRQVTSIVLVGDDAVEGASAESRDAMRRMFMMTEAVTSDMAVVVASKTATKKKEEEEEPESPVVEEGTEAAAATECRQATAMETDCHTKVKIRPATVIRPRRIVQTRSRAAIERKRAAEAEIAEAEQPRRKSARRASSAVSKK